MIREEDVWFCVMLGALAPVCAASFLLCKTRGRQCHLTGAVPSGPFTNPKIWECRALSHGNCADQSSGVISEGAVQGAQLRVVSQLLLLILWINGQSCGVLCPFCHPSHPACEGSLLIPW